MQETKKKKRSDEPKYTKVSVNFTVNETSGPLKTVHVPSGPQLEKGCRPLH